MKNIGIVGLGTIGTGVLQLLETNADLIAHRSATRLQLTRAVVQDTAKPRRIDLPPGILSNDLATITDDPNLSVVIQLVGGTHAAREIMLKLLRSGKDVVTANKALLAEHGHELFATARENGRTIAFEAAVAGGIPIVSAITQSLTANRITALRGILNGTTNYIVTQIAEGNVNYEQALAKAQELGYAEPDPTFDVDGSDAAQKLAILAQLAFGAQPDWKSIPCRGIDSIGEIDFTYSRQLGYRIKLISYARLADGGLQLSVSPMLVKTGSPLAEVRQNFNAISIVGDAVGPVFLHGQGAGQMPTASAVIADIIDTVVGRAAITFETSQLWTESATKAIVDQPGNLFGRNYLRFNVEDQPGVLAQIAGILGENGISIASVFQHDLVGDHSQAGVPVVILTQDARESAALTAVNQIVKLPVVHDEYERLRILD